MPGSRGACRRVVVRHNRWHPGLRPSRRRLPGALPRQVGDLGRKRALRGAARRGGPGGDYVLRKEPTADGGYRWEPDPGAEAEPGENLADVPAARRFLVERLDRVTVMPVTTSTVRGSFCFAVTVLRDGYSCAERPAAAERLSA